MYRLLAGTTHAIERHRRNLDRESRLQHRHAGNVGSLFPDGRHTPENDIFHLCRFQSSPLHSSLHDRYRQIDGQDIVEHTTATTSGRTDG